jgi:hypothetical protein
VAKSGKLSASRPFSTPARVLNEKLRAEAATELLNKCKIELPSRNTFEAHAVPDVQHNSETKDLTGTFNGYAPADKAMYMDPNVIDPFKLMEPQLRAMTESVKLLVTTDNPILHKVRVSIEPSLGPAKTIVRRSFEES